MLGVIIWPWTCRKYIHRKNYSAGEYNWNLVTIYLTGSDYFFPKPKNTSFYLFNNKSL